MADWIDRSPSALVSMQPAALWSFENKDKASVVECVGLSVCVKKSIRVSNDGSETRPRIHIQI